MVHLWIMNRIIHFFQKHKNVWNDKLGIRIQNRKLNSQIYWSFQQNHEQIFWITIAQDLDLCRYNISSTEGEERMAVISSYAVSCLMSCPGCTHHRIDSGVHTQRCVLRGERFAGRDDEVRVAGARSALCDVLQWWMAAQCCVVWTACRQEVRCLVSCHYLPCIGKDGGGKEAKRIHTWEQEEEGGRCKSFINHLIIIRLF